jgi:DNA-binding NtrC family response regulator
MHRQQPTANEIAGSDSQPRYILPNFSRKDAVPTAEEARIASLKILAMTLLRQVELLEKQIAVDNVTELNLQKEVHGFEAAIIRSALAKTGGRQRRAARLLGVKVTTLNTKIKRHKIICDEINAYPVDDRSPSECSDETNELPTPV